MVFNYYPLLVLVLLFTTTTFVRGYVARKKGIIPEFHSIPQLTNNGDKCQPLTIPTCRRLGYNSTSAKTNMYSNRLTGVDVQKYLSYFENEICFEDLVFFVCALFNPICFENHDIPVLPCKSACRDAKKECQGTLERFHRNWPLRLDCDDLPEYKTGICITRHSIVTKHQLDKHLKSNDLLKEWTTKQKQHACPRCAFKEHGLYGYQQFQNADFAIEGQLISRTKIFDGGLKLTFLVKKVFKRGSVKIEKYGYANLWSSQPCLCPELQYDQKYIMLGHEDKSQQTLLFNDNIIVVKKTRFRKRLLLLWKRIYRETKKNLNGSLTRHRMAFS